MALTLEQHTEVYAVLADEVSKASRAVVKAEKAYDSAPYAYGGSVEREAAAVLLNIRKAQYEAANKAANDYFDRFINV
jgi:hypothetical protein